MKSIVISCKNITEEAEKYEKSNSQSIPSHITDLLAQKKNKLSSILQNLMNTAKAHASNPGNPSTAATMEGHVSSLTDTIYEIVDILSHAHQPPASMPRSTSSTEIFEVEELKVRFLFTNCYLFVDIP